MAERRKLIGKGLAGSVLRNLLLELNEKSKQTRSDLKADRTKIPSKQLKEFRASDPYELLLKNIRTLFKTGLRIKEFNDLYHTSIKIESYKGYFTDKGIFKKHNNYNYRDLMVEGSGFLQWLNVFTLSLNPDIDIILLDEPDAHLHPSLQISMIKELEKISSTKQIFIATHSSEIIKHVSPEVILSIDKSPKYLTEEKQKVGLLAGIGTDYSPILDKVKRTKKILFIEGEIDFELLKKVGEAINEPINQDIVPWISPTSHKERKHLFIELKKEIPNLKGISIRDRDDESLNSVDNTLIDKSHTTQDDDLKLMKWKRRNIESYLILPEIIANLSGKPLQEINEYLTNNFAISIPNNYRIHNVPEVLQQIDGKSILKEHENSIKKVFDISRRQIINELNEDSICEDLITMVHAINEHLNN